ncbi:MAG: type II secretion system major pseudopilin GspG [Planctomycetes bacterium]|nr:type II secretion system major pseudopilin GspG [Planctomycetota bacterium]
MRTSGNRMRPGFTLIELLLVLVILATLAAIVVPKFAKRSEQARKTQALTQISSFETGLDAFEIDLGRYPTTQEGLTALVKKPVTLVKWEQPYLARSSVPKDPWGLPYTYRQPGQHNQYGYDLSSNGPDGQSGGEDDITNWSNEDGSSG